MFVYGKCDYGCQVYISTHHNVSISTSFACASGMFMFTCTWEEDALLKYSLNFSVECFDVIRVKTVVLTRSMNPETGCSKCSCSTSANTIKYIYHFKNRLVVLTTEPGCMAYFGIRG